MPSACFSGTVRVVPACSGLAWGGRGLFGPRVASLTSVRLLFSPQWDFWGEAATPLLSLHGDAPQWFLHLPLWPGLLLEHPLHLVLRLRPGDPTLVLTPRFMMSDTVLRVPWCCQGALRLGSLSREGWL